MGVPWQPGSSECANGTTCRRPVAFSSPRRCGTPWVRRALPRACSCVSRASGPAPCSPPKRWSPRPPCGRSGAIRSAPCSTRRTPARPTPWRCAGSRVLRSPRRKTRSLGRSGSQWRDPRRCSLRASRPRCPVHAARCSMALPPPRRPRSRRPPRGRSPGPKSGRAHAAPRVAEFPGGMLNAVGLANPGLAAVRDHELPWLAAHLGRARVIVNVAGATVDDYVAVIRDLADLAVITAFELNASCPNTSAGGLEFGATAEGVRELVRRCRGATTKPITVKLSPVVPDLTALTRVARDEGADAVTLVNTIPGALDHRLGNGSGGVSGPALLPIGVLATRRVTAGVGMPVIGVGGIRTARDVREYLAAGATLVAIGTAALADPRVPERVARELARG